MDSPHEAFFLQVARVIEALRIKDVRLCAQAVVISNVGSFLGTRSAILVLDLRARASDTELIARARNFAHVIAVGAESDALQAWELGAREFVHQTSYGSTIELAEAIGRLVFSQQVESSSQQSLKSDTKPICVFIRAKLAMLPPESIEVVTAQKKCVYMRTIVGESHRSGSLTLRQIERSYPDTFVRVNKSCLVNRSLLSTATLRRRNDGSCEMEFHSEKSNLVSPVCRHRTAYLTAQLAAAQATLSTPVNR